MATEHRRLYDIEGNLVSDEEIEVPDPPVDPIQAQIDALTNIVLSGGVA